jgi:ABC-type bacteriocin/lantibiotic exporter with double-glycine peptidase domain
MVIVAGGFLVSRAVLDYYYENVSDWFKARSAKQGALAETVGGLETIKALAVEPGRFLHWARKTADFAAAGANLRNGNRRFFRVTRLSDHILTLAVVAIGGYQMMHGTLTTGDLFAVLMLSGKISATLWVRRHRAAMAGGERLHQ